MSLFTVSPAQADFNWEDDSIEGVKGLHLLNDYGDGHEFISKSIDVQTVITQLKKLPWKTEFIQLIVVTQPGISMEVGGSLNGIDGLSAVYRNRITKEEYITVHAPESVREMEEILVSFLNGDDKWKLNFD